MPASTTAKTITPAALNKALEKAITTVAMQMSDTQFSEVVRLAGKLIAKNVKEELKL